MSKQETSLDDLYANNVELFTKVQSKDFKDIQTRKLARDCKFGNKLRSFAAQQQSLMPQFRESRLEALVNQMEALVNDKLGQ